MFCSNCGQAIEEGKAFCKACGTPAPGQANAHAEELVASRAAAMAAAPPAPEETPVIEVPPPPPPVPAPGYGPAWQPPQGPTGRRSNTGLIWGIVAAVIVVLAGAGVGLYFAFFGDDGETAASTTTVVDSSSTTDSVTSSTGGQTGTTSGGANTTQTIPGLTSTTEGGAGTTDEGPGTTDDLLTAYLAAADNLVMVLEYEDERIPVLAAEINNKAPGVPVEVRDELSTMLGTLDAFNVELASLDVPPPFEDSYFYLDQAVTHMGNRIYATIQGIERMWDTGKVVSANAFFDEGRTERDGYRVAMRKYYDNLPIE
jgi:hypothetical protein